MAKWLLLIYKLMENGTHNRKWYTDEKNNIAFSFYIETNCNIEKLDGITVEIAKTILEVFKNLYNIVLEIKEPNDIVCNGRKIAGILTQSKSIENTLKYLIIGIGINTNQQKFNEEISNIATSIKNEFNTEIDNEKVISEFCNLFENKIIKMIKN